MKEVWKYELKAKMEKYEQTPPEGLWESIDTSVPRKNVHHISWSTGRKWTAAAAVLILCTVSGITLFRNGHRGKIEATALNNTLSTPDREVRSLQKEESSVLPDETIAGLPSPITYYHKEHDALFSGQESDTVSLPDENIIAQEKKEIIIDESEAVSQSGNSVKEKDADMHKKERIEENNYLYLDQTGRRERKYTASLYYSGSAGSTSHQSLSGFDLMSYDAANGSPTIESASVMAGKIDAKDKNVKHRQPITFAFAFRYDLSKRWSLESGIFYSFHNSTIDEERSGVRTHTRQKLNYFGIPVTFSYSIWKNERFNFYLSAGGRAEKMLFGETETTTYVNEIQSERIVRNIEIKPVQFSVNAAAGFDVKLYRFLSIYIEPGVGYYFDNDSEVSTIYTQQPVNFMLNMGLRFSVNK